MPDDPSGQESVPPPSRHAPDSALDRTDEIIDAGGKVDREALFALYEREQGDDETPIAVTFVLRRDLNKRVDRYLVDRIPFLSRTSLQRLIREQAVTVNDRVPKASTRLRLDDVVRVVLPPPPSTEIPAENIPLDVLAENEHFIVINKADDIIVHPARGNRSGTIINALAFHFQNRTEGALSTVGEEFARPGVVHRLDRHTTGVMVAAKSDVAHWRIARQFEYRTTDKRYLALVHGQLEPRADVIDLPLGKHPTLREKYAVRWDETGKASVTLYRVREVYEGFSLVELELKTGRTHQIRVHLSHLGFPIVGDDMYGGRHITGSEISPSMPSAHLPVITRQALHAATLAFDHPVTEERLRFHAPLRPDMLRVIAALRAHRFIARPTIAGATLDLDALIPMM